MSPDKYPELLADLNRVMEQRQSGVKVLSIKKAESQTVNGQNYRISADAFINGKPSSCCITAFYSMSAPFQVKCISCDKCTCY